MIASLSLNLDRVVATSRKCTSYTPTLIWDAGRGDQVKNVINSQILSTKGVKGLV